MRSLPPTDDVSLSSESHAVDENLHVVLVHPEIHWNTGNTGRSCLAFGARLHLVEPLGFSLDERQVRRAGLDYWHRVALTVHATWSECEAILPGLGEAWFLSANAPRSLWDVALGPRNVFVLGCESVGLPAELRAKFADRLVAVPQSNSGVRSLNLSTTAALAMAEHRRRAPGRGEAALLP